jgi:signal transduction histidine kinase
MGHPTLERQLRARLLAVIAPALVGVGAAAVAVTAYVLDIADRRTAAARAESALRTLSTEQGEGDSLETAVTEVLGDAEDSGVRVAVRGGALSTWRHGIQPVPTSLLLIAAGQCATANDAAGQVWRGCAVQKGDYVALAAVPVSAHRALVWTLAKAMAAVVGLALLGIVWAVRRSVHGSMDSLAKLLRWAEKVTEDARAPPLPEADTEDVARLASSFDRVVQRLFEALVRERASSAHIAHELRTPLTAIVAELEALPASAQVDAIARVRQDAARLGRVIDAILVLSAPRDAAVHEGVVNVADVARELARPGTDVDAPEEALIDGDARLVSLAIHNLLDNALKYSGHAARALRISRVAEAIRVAVLDDGPGLDEAHRARMFDRYWRGGADGGGSGLGLAFVRAVAERHGGSVEARPNPEGRGLEVAMTLGRSVGWHDGRGQR